MHDGVRQAELLNIGNSQRGTAVFSGGGKTKHADAYEHWASTAAKP